MATPVGFLGRCWNHDYKSRCIYMITMTTAERRAILGRLRTASCPPPNRTASCSLSDKTVSCPPPDMAVSCPTSDRAACCPPSDMAVSCTSPNSAGITQENVCVEITAIGKILEQTWLEIPKKFPGVKVFEYQIMPDHFHGIIFFERPQDKPLGSVVGFLKAHTASLCKQAGLLPGSGADSSLSVLWSKGYTDSILLHKGQLESMRGYIKDNPRRLAVKRANRDLFKVVSHLPFGNGTFMALGNHFLLDAPFFHQIQCSRSITPQELEQKKEDCYNAIRRGAVIVSPCISSGEREIARDVYEARGRLIVLKNKGFAPLYKPAGAMFDACAEGRILLLAPSAWGYVPGKKPLTRLDACVMNRIAQMICKEDAVAINYRGMKPADIDGLVKAALCGQQATRHRT